MSRWLVGSSRSRHSGSAASTWASSTRSLKPPERVDSRVVVDLRRDAEALQDLPAPGLEGVAVVAGDDVLELRVPFAVEMVVRPGEQFVSGPHRVPELSMAHHRDLEDRGVLVQEVILLEGAEAEPFRSRDRPRARLLLTREDAEQGGLARSVGAHQTVPATRVELESRALEEDLGSVPLGEVRDGDHGGRA